MDRGERVGDRVGDRFRQRVGDHVGEIVRNRVRVRALWYVWNRVSRNIWVRVRNSTNSVRSINGQG